MNVNCINIGREEESSIITNINILIRFNKTREIFPSVTRVLSILLTTAATSANLERVNSKERVRFPARLRLWAMRRGELSEAITQLMSKCLWSGWNWEKGYKEIASHFTCCPVSREYSWKKSQIEKKKWIMLHIMYEQALGAWWMKSVLNLSWWKSILHRNRWVFYLTRTSVMKELVLFYLHVMIKIYSLIWQNNWHLCFQISK